MQQTHRTVWKSGAAPGQGEIGLRVSSARAGGRHECAAHPLEPTPWCTSEQPVRCPGVLSVRTPPTAFLFAHLPFVVVQRAPADTVAFHILQAGKRTTVHAPSMRSDVVGAKSKGRLMSAFHCAPRHPRRPSSVQPTTENACFGGRTMQDHSTRAAEEHTRSVTIRHTRPTHHRPLHAERVPTQPSKLNRHPSRVRERLASTEDAADPESPHQLTPAADGVPTQ